MSTDAAIAALSPHAVVTAAWSAFASRDPAQIAAVFTDDAEWLAPPDNPAARAMGGVHHFVGRDEIARFIAVLFPQVFVSDVDIQFTGIYVDGNVVVVEERMRATLAHGGHYDNEYCFVFEVGDGRIRRVREYMDTQRGAAWFATPQPQPATPRGEG